MPNHGARMTDPAAQTSTKDPHLVPLLEPSDDQQRCVRQLARAIGRSGLTGPFAGGLAADFGAADGQHRPG